MKRSEYLKSRAEYSEEDQEHLDMDCDRFFELQSCDCIGR